MLPTNDARWEKIRSCLDDLRINGIELAGADICQLQEVVHQHLDYFQLMLGYEPGEREVVSLLRREVRPVARH